MTRTVCLMLIASIHAGCSMDRPYPDRSYYTLAAGDLAALEPASGESGVVRVTRARVAPPFGSRFFQYRVGDNRYEADYYERWADDPGALITAACLRALDTSGRFQAVLDEGTIAASNNTLELYVSALYADVMQGGAPHAVLIMHATVIGSDGEIRLSRDYEASTPAASSSAADLVRAWNTSLESILSALMDDLSV